MRTVPSIGPVTATTFVATIDDVGRFRRAHEVEAYLGLVPREFSSGETQRRGPITKAGSSRTRWLLIQAAVSILRRRPPAAEALRNWAIHIAARRGKHVVVVALARRLRALRTETTINDAYDFAIGRRLSHLSALRKVGFQANRRLLDVQRISHDCAIGDAAFTRISRPVTVEGQRAAALRFADPVVLALLSVLVVFRLLPDGWRHRDLGAPLAALLGLPALPAGRMTYQLRRLRLHGLIERLPGTHRYRVTEPGLRLALFFTRVHARLFRPGLSVVMPDAAQGDAPLRRAFAHLEHAMDQWCEEARLAA